MRYNWAALVVLTGALVATVGTRTYAVVIASDSASNAAYAAEVDGAWKGTYNGTPPLDENPPGNDNGGSGFLPWNFSGGYHVAGGPYGVLNHFIAGVDFPSTSYNNLGAPAFGLGNAPVGFSGPTTAATRPFVQPMAVGDVFTADFDTPAAYDDYTGFGFPFAIITFNDSTAAGTFGIEAGSSVVYGDFNWRYYDANHASGASGDYGVDAGVGSIAPTATSDGSSIRLEITSATTGRVTFDGASLDVTFSGGLPTSVTFTIFDNNAEAALPGDFDGSTSVGAIDLTQWKGDFAVDAGSNADGDMDSDGNDFLLWQQFLGVTTGVPTGEHAFFFDNLKIERPSGTAASVPEPASLAMAALVAAAAFARRRAR